MTLAEQLIQEGVARGRVEGRAEGRAEGQHRLLKRQLVAKFGELPPRYAAWLEAACETQLESLAERILSADSLETAFGL